MVEDQNGAALAAVRSPMLEISNAMVRLYKEASGAARLRPGLTSPAPTL
jgi:hypothetical protein